VANYAQHYIIAYMPGLFLNGLFDGQRRFLNSLGRSDDPLLFQFIGVFMHVGWCYLFVTKMGLEIVGIGYASTISNLTVYTSLVIYSSCIPELSEAVFLPDKKTFRMLS
jgi:Na+-driven multidrug efflux pump